MATPAFIGTRRLVTGPADALTPFIDRMMPWAIGAGIVTFGVYVLADWIKRKR